MSADGGFPIIIPPTRGRRINWFAGGGLTSRAMKDVFGEDPDAALNHWPVAVYSHMRHHPGTQHFLSDVFEIDPDSVFPGEHIDFGWFSPDCTDFSKAKGKALRSERRRGLAWVMVDWARKRRPDVMMMENVQEWLGWGPLFPEGHPQAGERDPSREGETFREWKAAMEALGGVVDFRTLVSADYGDPTTRERLYGVIRFDGKPIAWPARTHAPRKDAARLGLKPWRGVCEVLDFQLPCPSIFMSRAEAKAEHGLRVNRPLQPATLRRVARGIDRFVIRSGDPFIVPITQRVWGGDRAHDAADPLKTVTTARGGEFAMAQPFLAPVTHQGDARVYDPQDPLRTATAAHRGELAVVSPNLVRTDMASAAGRNGIHDTREPMRTQTTAGGLAVSASVLAQLAHGDHAKGPGDRVRDVRDPINAVTAGGGDQAVVAAHIAKFRADSAGADAAEPCPTVTANSYLKRPGGAAPLGVVAASLQRQFGKGVGSDAGDPAGSVTAGGGGKTALVQAEITHVQRQFGTATGSDAAEPLGTVLAGAGGGKSALVSAAIVGCGGRRGQSPPVDVQNPFPVVTAKADACLTTAMLTTFQQNIIGSDPAEPLSTVMAGAPRHGLGVANLVSYYGQDAVLGSDAGDPMRTATGKDRHGLSTAFIHQSNTGLVGREATEPASTIVLKGCTQQLVEARLALEGGEVRRRGQVLAFLWDQFGEPTPAEWADPTGTVEARLKFGLVILPGVAAWGEVGPQVWMIVDIGLRMLTPRELMGAMGHEGPDADLSLDVFDKPITRTDQTHMVGNGVSRGVVRALIAANCLPGADETLELEAA